MRFNNMTIVTTQLTWEDVIGKQKTLPYFRKIIQFVQKEQREGKTIYPVSKDIFSAFKHTPFSEVKVIILGQDPYHGPNQAHGLSFSVPDNMPLPPSLSNIFKAIVHDFGLTQNPPRSGNLIPWAQQGVLLLNTVLTVEAHKPQSHAKLGWETFTDAVISALSTYHQHLVFLLWGAYARKKSALIDPSKHCILTAAHPSPLSAHRGFLECQHFSQTNHKLRTWGKSPIDWTGSF